MLLTLLYVLLLAWTVSAVSVAIPIDGQLPLIARVDQPYSWSPSPSTFASTSDLNYSVSSLPGWLSFDPPTCTFRGIPSHQDEGCPAITVTASDSTSSASSKFTLCVTSYPAPSLNIPLAAQFNGTNKAMSSVFPLSLNSALETPNPCLRIPPKWSFSIGFDSSTFTAPHNIYYAVLQSDGFPLPDWMEFNEKSLTLNGVVPHDIQWPSGIFLDLIASDQEGYTAQKLPFTIVVSPHELSESEPPPTVNITQGTPLNARFASPDDFAGIQVDGISIDPSNITNLSIDRTSVPWLNYDQPSRVLSGTPPDDCAGQRYLLPLTITAFNQSLHTNLSLDIVRSFFLSTIPPQDIGDERTVNFTLVPYFSNATGDNPADVSLSAAFDSPEGGDCLSFDAATATLYGTIPQDFFASHIDVTFTAYSRQTHSTSHVSLSLNVPSSTTKKKAFTHPTNLSAAAHRKLTLALGIVFGVIGSVCALGVFLSAFRRCAKVEDSVKADEEGRKFWTDNEKRWYGVAEEKPRNAMEIENPFGPGAELATPVRNSPDYGALGLGLRRVAERSGSDPVSHVGSPGSAQSPGVMRKGEFMTRIRQTVRNVSDKYRKVSAERPRIGKPTLVVPPTGHLSFNASDPFDDSNVPSYPGSTVITNSPSTSTGEHSIPRRRADFAPPKSPALAHIQDGLVRQLSSGSLSSDEEEAVVHIASRATSIRSGISEHNPTVPRPRLVPFTSAARVPVPRVPSLSSGDASSGPARRVTSHKAVVMKEPTDDVMMSPTIDELSVGIQYVRALGGDHHSDVRPDLSTPTVSTHVRSSFSSLESSHHGHAAAGSVMRTLVRAGEKFKFRVAVSMYSAASYKKVQKLEAKLMSGKPLPKFMHVDMNGYKHADAVEFYGAPAARDLGEYSVGVYTIDDGACVGRIVVEVVGASR